MTVHLAVLAVLFAPCAQAAPKTIRWVLAHEPAGVFERAAKDFAAEVSRETRGEIEVRVLSMSEYARGRRIAPDEVADRVAAGEVEMTQTYAASLSRGTPELMLLELPYLFRDHAHAAVVLDGEIGGELLAALEPRGVTGLAFTYSGGYRILPAASREVRRPEDFRGLRVITSGSPVARETFRALGAVPVDARFEEAGEFARAGKADASETTFARYEEPRQREGLPVVNDTRHSLFTTTVLINAKFFAGLSPSHRQSLRRAAARMARAERARAIEDGERVRNEAAAKGAKLVEPDRAAMAAATRPVYARFKRLAPLVERVEAVR